MRRFELDVRAVRSVGRLRLFGAVLVFGMGLALVWRGAGTIGWVIVVTSWLIGLGWVAAFALSRRRAREADSHYLELDTRGLTMARGGEPVRVGWDEVASVEVDEDRLVVWVQRRIGERVRIDPVWRGVSLEQLCDALRAGLEEHATRS